MAPDAVIVSTARTPIGKAYRGAFNATLGPTLGAHAVRAAIAKAGVDEAEVEDCLMGAALQQGSQSPNIGRLVALRAGLPVSTPGMSIDRQCASGLMAIATAAKQVIVDRQDVVVAGGLESISTVQTPEMRVQPDQELIGMHSAIYMPMLQTAETVAQRYGISREAQDEYSLVSQKRLAEVADDYYNVRIAGGEGHMEVGKHILATVDKKAHMVTSIKPFGCMPSTQSDGVQSKVMSKLKDSIFIPIETTGDGEVNIKSRVQMKLFEAKVKAREELQRALDEHGVTLEEVRAYVGQHPQLHRPIQKLPHLYVGTAPNFVAQVATRMGRKRRIVATAAH